MASSGYLRDGPAVQAQRAPLMWCARSLWTYRRWAMSASPFTGLTLPASSCRWSRAVSRHLTGHACAW